MVINRETVRLDSKLNAITLDILRGERGLTEVKEGCREGDCGACTVMLGSLRQNGTVDYQAVNSCLLPAAAIAGKHLVTVKGINPDGSNLNPIQEAFLAEGAVQCGFCTPGILMALTAHLLSAREPDTESACHAIAGNICRCTGYAAIRRAVDRLFKSIPHLWGKERVKKLISLEILPEYFIHIPEKLKAIKPAAESTPGDIENNQVYVAGGTDLFVHPSHELKCRPLKFLDPATGPNGIKITRSHMEVTAELTTEAFRRAPKIRQLWPKLPEMLKLVSSVQIRNRATIAGNIVNASPIGDISIILLALDAELELTEKGKKRRMPLKVFFIDYKKTALPPGGRLTRLFIPLPGPEVQFHFEKVSRRQHLDIASVNTAIQISLRDGRITDLGLAAGGVAPVPLFLEQTVAFLRGKVVTATVLEEALAVLDREIAPISDMRGSAEYKRRLLRNLFLSHFLTLFPDRTARDSSFLELLKATGNPRAKKSDSRRRRK